MGMCDKESEQKTETVSSVPDYVTAGSEKLVQKASDLADKPFKAYSGDRVADFTGDQQNAFQMLRDYISGSPDLAPEAIQGARNYAGAPAQSISTERIVDEDGRLGAISEYLNPYVDAALDPVIRRITEQAQKQRIALGNRATTSGAYGDQRHGVVEAGINEGANLAVGDTAKQFYMDAFDKAMGLRGNDLSRLYQTDVTNANLAERALDRELSGSKSMLDMQAQDQQTQLNNIGQLLGIGTLQQSVSQAELDAAYTEFLREYQHSFDVVKALSAALSGLPFERTQTTTATEPDNSLLGTIGSVAGTVLGGMVGGPAGAAVGSSLGGGLGNTGANSMVGPTTVDPSLPWL